MRNVSTARRQATPQGFKAACASRAVQEGIGARWILSTGDLDIAVASRLAHDLRDALGVTYLLVTDSRRAAGTACERLATAMSARLFAPSLGFTARSGLRDTRAGV